MTREEIEDKKEKLYANCNYIAEKVIESLEEDYYRFKGVFKTDFNIDHYLDFVLEDYIFELHILEIGGYDFDLHVVFPLFRGELFKSKEEIEQLIEYMCIHFSENIDYEFLKRIKKGE